MKEYNFSILKKNNISEKRNTDNSIHNDLINQHFKTTGSQMQAILSRTDCYHNGNKQLSTILPLILAK